MVTEQGELFFDDQADSGYVSVSIDGVTHTLAIGSKNFVDWLSFSYYKATKRGRSASESAIKQAGFALSGMGENPSSLNDGPRKPVEMVSWDDVQQFMEALNRQMASLNARLPKEAEWEYACRAGTETPFSFGDNITPQQVNYYGDRPYANGEEGEYRGTTVAVKSLPANAWGLFEMHGNVWEWCQDGWQADLGSNDLDDPLFDPQDQDLARVWRGGGWDRSGRECVPRSVSGIGQATSAATSVSVLP